MPHRACMTVDDIVHMMKSSNSSLAGVVGQAERNCLDTYKLVELSRCLLVSYQSILKFNSQHSRTNKLLSIELGNSTSLASLVGQGKRTCLDTYKWWELSRRLLVSYGLNLKFNPEQFWSFNSCTFANSSLSSICISVTRGIKSWALLK